MALPQGHGCPRPRWHQYLENCPVSARKFATISSDKVGLVSWMASRNSWVLARCFSPPEVLAFKGALRRLPRRKFNIGRREQL
jgi:hypothetical protein